MYLVKTGKKPPLLDFSLTVINQMIVRFGTPTHMARSGRSSSALANPIRLTARYFPSVVPPIATNPRPRRICHVCRHTNRQEKKTSKYPLDVCGLWSCIMPSRRLPWLPYKSSFLVICMSSKRIRPVFTKVMFTPKLKFFWVNDYSWLGTNWTLLRNYSIGSHFKRKKIVHRFEMSLKHTGKVSHANKRACANFERFCEMVLYLVPHHQPSQK